MTKVSIIIPFHNVENYIEECLTSVVNQTLKDIEIICIDDGSTDNSRSIVENFKANDNRIILLSCEEQKGQSTARNMAIDIAKGDFIGFVDADDIADTTMFEKLFFNADITGADITMCQANLLDDKTKELSSNDYFELKSFDKYSNSAFTAEMTPDELLNYPAVIWNKIFRTKFLKTINAKFAEGFIYEDLPFCYETYIKAQKVNIVWEKLYNYRINREFSTMQNSDKKVYDRIPMVSKTYDLFQNLSYFDKMNGKFISWITEDIFHRYTLLEKQYYEPYYYEMKKLFESFEIGEKEKEEIEKSYCNKELYCIREEDYFGFWKFLIEKYKSSNKQIKEAQHRCNQDIIAIKAYLEECQQNFEQKIKYEVATREDYFNKKLTTLEEEKAKTEEENKCLKEEKTVLLEEKENEINAKLELLQIKDEIIKDKENLVIEKEEELREKEEQLQQQRNELEEKDVTIAFYSSDARKKDEELIQKKSELENKEKELQDKTIIIEEKISEIEQKNSIIENQNSSLTEKDKIIVEKEFLILEKANIVEEKQQEIEKYTNELQEKENTIDNQNKTLIEKDSIILEKENLIKEKDDTINQHQTKINDIESKVNYLEKKLEEKTIEITVRADENRKKEENLIREFNEKLQAQKGMLEEQLEKQKDYYENNYLLVKIALAISKTTEDINNTIKKIFKKN